MQWKNEYADKAPAELADQPGAGNSLMIESTTETAAAWLWTFGPESQEGTCDITPYSIAALHSPPAISRDDALPRSPVMNRISSEEEAQLRDALKRCSPATAEAAYQFRNTGNPEFLPDVVLGIIERYVERELRDRVRSGDDTVRLVEDLHVDSLTLIEVVLLTEEVLKICIDNEDLRQLRTIGDVKKFIDAKVRGVPTEICSPRVESSTSAGGRKHSESGLIDFVAKPNSAAAD
jgi:acyl carrier protein